MARKLDHITRPLKRFLTAGPRALKLPSGDARHLPPALRIAYEQGDALLTLTFFDFLQQSGVDDPAWSLKLREQILRNGRNLLDIAQRIGLMAQFKGRLEDTPEKSAYIAWCIMLSYLKNTNEFDLFETATHKMYRHYFLGMFPQKMTTNTADSDSLRKACLKLLRKHWGPKTELKESFITEENTVQFALKIKHPGYSWLTVNNTTGERLKPTRKLAYSNLLASLEDGKIRPEDYHSNRLLPVK